jgi:DNA repair exonuclease SbcCD ATPase subunit
MDDTFAGDHDSSFPSPGPGSPVPQEDEPQPDIVVALEKKIHTLMQEKAVLLQKQEYVLRKLSRNGQGTISNIEAVTDRAIQQCDALRVENEQLRVLIERLESDLLDLQDKIAHTRDKLDRAEDERVKMVQSKRRWIMRMWALAGRVPGELRKKDAEIDNMREKLIDMHARLAQGQSELRKRQGQLDEERTIRMGVEADLHNTKSAHEQGMKERDLAGQRLGDQLKRMVDGLASGAISI